MAVLLGITISDRYVTLASVTGESMHPTFTAANNVLQGIVISICKLASKVGSLFPIQVVRLPFVLTRVLEPGDFVLAERRCLEKYEFSHGDVILFK